MVNNGREIKFRAWLKLAEEMIEVRELSFYDKGLMSIDYNVCIKLKDGTEHSWYEVEEADNFILMQYTGLKDTKGVEIYEGDIVKYRDELYEIKWMFSGFYLHNPKGGFIELAECDNCCEVVGNIYENPELLEIRYE